MIYYLAHKYTGIATKSHANCVGWVHTLRLKGIKVFSPILHTHIFHEILIYKEPYCSSHDPDAVLNKIMDYVQWDLDLLEGWLKHDGHEKYTKFFCDVHGDLYWPQLLTEEKQKDLQCDGLITEKDRVKESYFSEMSLCCGRTVEPTDIEATYDRGLTVLMAADAYTTEKEVSNDTLWQKLLRTHTLDADGRLWLSTGCLQEKRWSDDHHVRVLKLEPFLEGVEEDL